MYLQVRPKYVQCVAISCFYIAAKTLEEDEVGNLDSHVKFMTLKNRSGRSAVASVLALQSKCRWFDPCFSSLSKETINGGPASMTSLLAGSSTRTPIHHDF